MFRGRSQSIEGESADGGLLRRVRALSIGRSELARPGRFLCEHASRRASGSRFSVRDETSSGCRGLFSVQDIRSRGLRSRQHSNASQERGPEKARRVGEIATSHRRQKRRELSGKKTRVRKRRLGKKEKKGKGKGKGTTAFCPARD